MQLLLTAAHNLTAPTVETLREYAQMRFEKLARFLPNFKGEHIVRISVQKERHFYVVIVEVKIPQSLVIRTKDLDLRKALDDAYQTIKNQVVNKKQKRFRRK